MAKPQFDLEFEYSDDVRSEDDKSVMQILQHKSEDEPDWKIVPAYQTIQVMAAIAVIPGTYAHTPS